MKIFSPQEAAAEFGFPDIVSFTEAFLWRSSELNQSLYLPADSGAKVGLARIVSSAFLERGPALIWVTEYGIWSSSEHMELFDRYRASYGETRTIREAPIHVFESDEELDSMISILSLGLFFIWGMEVTDTRRSIGLTISHDEWLEYRFTSGNEEFGKYFDTWIKPNLRQERSST